MESKSHTFITDPLEYQAICIRTRCILFYINSVEGLHGCKSKTRFSENCIFSILFTVALRPLDKLMVHVVNTKAPLSFFFKQRKTLDVLKLGCLQHICHHTNIHIRSLNDHYIVCAHLQQSDTVMTW